ncbi:hypothetical protein [Haloglomus litoreum]|uniref:hypothetical protein n=1 Tax=Haloglomus litoreum TaxID=3034026 RepID=UPI0023E80AF2|nr:hypothetical protein [Haloglomus sp. DT116]
MHPSATPEDVAASLATARRALDEGDETVAAADLGRAADWLRALGRGIDRPEAFIYYEVLDERLAAIDAAVDAGEDSAPAVRIALQHAEQLVATLLGPEAANHEPAM